MSLELRITSEGLCECGIPHNLGYEPGCRHDIECDWGTFSDPPLFVTNYVVDTTTVDNVAPLILVSKHFADTCGRDPCTTSDVITDFHTDDAGRRFMTLSADNGSWTWELFEAHWEDGQGPENMFVGRWPD